METSLWLQPQLNDIVFEHRNKAYGAFLLRSGYNQNMSRSILISIGLFVMVFMGFRFYLKWISGSSFADKIIEIEKVVMLENVYQVEKLRMRPMVKALPPAVKSQNATATPKVVSNEKVVEAITPPPDDVIQPGITGPSNEAPTDKDPIDVGPGGGSDVVVEPVSTAPVPEYLLDQKPEFPGGDEAMYKYLKSHLSFPEMARETNIDGTIVMQFMISATGEIEQVTIVRTPSVLFNRTSLETIKGMPKWKPGIYHGQPVAVMFTLPMKFELL